MPCGLQQIAFGLEGDLIQRTYYYDALGDNILRVLYDTVEVDQDTKWHYLTGSFGNEIVVNNRWLYYTDELHSESPSVPTEQQPGNDGGEVPESVAEQGRVDRPSDDCDDEFARRVRDAVSRMG